MSCVRLGWTDGAVDWVFLILSLYLFISYTCFVIKQDTKIFFFQHGTFKARTMNPSVPGLSSASDQNKRKCSQKYK